jgi:MYXO-CTERM domain-containing protein
VVGSVLDGGSFTFEDAVKGFRVTGISPALGLNPENPVAFITGLKFNQPGQAELSMPSITAEVPEPTTWALALSSLLLAGGLRARRRR